MKFLARRLEFRKRRGPGVLMPGGALWKEYFEFGRGVRSFVRDAFLKR